MTWFKTFGWIYRPASIAGWLVTAAALGAIVWAFLAVDRNSHSVSDTLIGTFPWAVIFAILWNWVAGHTTGSLN